MDHRSRVFASVFAVPSLSHTTPTPIATPDLGYTALGQSFGSPFVANATGQHRAVKRNLAWSTATRFLSLPKSSNSGGVSFEIRQGLKTADVEEALRYLITGDGKTEDGNEESLLDWYTSEARLHFATAVRPILEHLWEKEIKLSSTWSVLEETQQILQHAQDLYMQSFNDHLIPVIQQLDGSVPTIRRSKSAISPSESANRKFRRDLHAVFAHSLPSQRLSKTLSYVLYDAGCAMFRLFIRQHEVQIGPPPEDPTAIRERMITVLDSLERVGLGGDTAQKAFAHAMDRLMDTFINSHYLKVDWYSQKSTVPHLRMWIKDGFCPFVELVLASLKSDTWRIQPTELQQWQDMALGRLGKARVETLFDFVIKWPKSMGAIQDIKEYLKLLNAKNNLTTAFRQQVARRLLHPGATTTWILNVYISIIHVFQTLEPKGVQLERVARPIRNYLKEREDTGRIIISSLLTDSNDRTKFGAGGELSYEIASEMQKPFANFNQEEDEELNWGDMNWQPAPTDASPDFKKSKVEDVIWFLLTLWDREEFINELKNILGDHLLKAADPEFEKEIRLLELIKVRLGDDKLQACEVMLRDVLDSKRINASIRASGNSPQPQGLQLPRTPDGVPKTPESYRLAKPSKAQLLPPSTPDSKPLQGPTLNAQILSSFFWPSLRDDEFRVPAEIEALQKDYESRFERIKGMRKLRWMNALGDGSVTLDFEDRTETFDKVFPWQVSVVYAFQPKPGEEWAAGKGKGKGKSNQAVTRNVQQLEEMLEMDEQLIRQALSFWVGKSVLREVSTDTYSVIENKSSAPSDSAAAAAAEELAEVQAQEQGAVRSQADVLLEKKDIYQSFIMGMLTAQGNIPVMRILMMMRMLVVGGFPFGEEEVKMLLEEMETEGKVIGMGGDVWGIKKA
ncbi:hypothetical protein P154DRAFT_492082 [Amniculicola lignicola CBS 123094]|uniref:Anaphase-promoting complex subunit 2 n=1 Tax=Amniculicola lignicola CBS 123094 TaxID=1392246 RepID=A0A6A5WEV6_9PLEO|nr:hypothetical protein P154DRAFT_492082 [Amniculicola lignicola CBS 123094]